MADPSYTDAEVDLAAEVLKQRCPLCRWTPGRCPAHANDARAVLDALAAAGRLLPAGTRLTPYGKVWYRSCNPDGTVWCETSDPGEVVRMSAGLDVTYWRLDGADLRYPWRPWEPPQAEGKPLPVEG